MFPNLLVRQYNLFDIIKKISWLPFYYYIFAFNNLILGNPNPFVGRKRYVSKLPTRDIPFMSNYINPGMVDTFKRSRMIFLTYFLTGIMFCLVNSQFRLNGNTYNGNRWRRQTHTINKYDMTSRLRKTNFWGYCSRDD